MLAEEFILFLFIIKTYNEFISSKCSERQRKKRWSRSRKTKNANSKRKERLLRRGPIPSSLKCARSARKLLNMCLSLMILSQKQLKRVSRSSGPKTQLPLLPDYLSSKKKTSRSAGYARKTSSSMCFLLRTRLTKPSYPWFSLPRSFSTTVTKFSL